MVPDEGKVREKDILALLPDEDLDLSIELRETHTAAELHELVISGISRIFYTQSTPIGDKLKVYGTRIRSGGMHSPRGYGRFARHDNILALTAVKVDLGGSWRDEGTIILIGAWSSFLFWHHPLISGELTADLYRSRPYPTRR